MVIFKLFKMNVIESRIKSKNTICVANNLKKLSFLILLFSGNLLFAQNKNNLIFEADSKPVFQLNYTHPTADKPQSKLWFMDNCWWAILPDSTGPTIWQRTENEWKDFPEVTVNLKGVPGRADVWADKNQITAVGVADSSLTVFRLKGENGTSPNNWKSEILAKLYPPVPATIETATIAGDGNGNWWVAATASLKVCVWASSDDGKNWNAPTILADGINDDDICVITPLKDGIGVIWSDQVRDAILMRVHKNGKPVSFWEKEEIADAGNKTADDHLNTSLSPDGTLWLLTKNSVDKVGQPQFVLRIRSVDGKWANKPYLNLESRMKRPSRPIVIATEDNSAVFVGHGDNDRSVPYPYNSNMTFAQVDTSLSTIMKNPQIIISPDTIYRNVVHNVTGPKKPFPKNGPWIVLAADSEGRIYESDLRNLIQK